MAMTKTQIKECTCHKFIRLNDGTCDVHGAVRKQPMAAVDVLTVERDDDDGLEMHDDSCGECGHPYKRGDETHYPECSRIEVE